MVKSQVKLSLKEAHTHEKRQHRETLRWRPATSPWREMTRTLTQGFPGGSASQCRRCGFDPSPGTIPHAAEQLSPCTLKPTLCDKRSHSNEKPTCRNQSGPRLPQPEKKSTQKRRPSTDKNTSIKIFFKKGYP